MARLSSLPPRIGAVPTKLGTPPRQVDEPQGRYRANAPWRAWYSTAEWQALRLRVFVRDAYTCQRTGELCTGKHPAPNSPVANHKRPHRGNRELFFDETNIETVTKAVHDSTIQAEEQESLRHKGVWD